MAREVRYRFKILGRFGRQLEKSLQIFRLLAKKEFLPGFVAPGVVGSIPIHRPNIQIKHLGYP
jgi:hypothetical protein